MPVRRTADPISVQHVWDAIRFASSQKQMADLPRIVKYLQKVDNCSQTQAELYLQQTLDDGLVVLVWRQETAPISTELTEKLIWDQKIPIENLVTSISRRIKSLNKVVTKGQATGNPVETYRVPFEDLQVSREDGKDWYCIECHLAGDVSHCTSCFRVFHAECSTKARSKMDHFKKQPTVDAAPEISNNQQNKEITLPQIPFETDTNQTNSEKDVDLVEMDMSLESLPNLSTTTSEENQMISKKNFVYDESLCSICNLVQFDIECGMEKDEMNHLLGFLLMRIKSWVPENITDCMAPDTNAEWMTDDEKNWRASQLFFKKMDMVTIERKLKSREYTRLCDFFADVVQTRHNIGVYHGTESQEYGAAELMLRDCIHDINELRNCFDCYKYSNEKINNKWFCLPCRVPHKLVWAKQKGYPYWPAKVIIETHTNCDVRFFGGKYERSILPKNSIKPITTALESLNIKRSSAFNRAYQELLLHQKVLTDPVELNKLLSMKVKRRDPVRRMSLPPDAGRKNNRMPKIAAATTNRKLNKTLGAKEDIFDFNDSVADFETFHLQKSYTPKRKVERSESLKTSKKAKTEGPIKIEKVQPTNRSSDVINISDGEEENDESADKGEYSAPHSFDTSLEPVTSSTEYFRNDDSYKENSENSMQQLDQPYCDAVEKLRRKLETALDKKDLIKTAMDCMQSEIDKITNEHNDHLRKLFDAHNTQLSDTKKKQWCYNCEQDAIYHCCWNTAYCSTTCQQQHWQAEHKKVCRRKR